ncbi:hypothetical protein SEVIR_9G479332v4 [Setaria viridis]
MCAWKLWIFCMRLSLLFNSPCSLAASTLVCMLHSYCTYFGKSCHQINAWHEIVSILSRLLHMLYQFLSRHGSFQYFLGVSNSSLFMHDLFFSIHNPFGRK